MGENILYLANVNDWNDIDMQILIIFITMIFKFISSN